MPKQPAGAGGKAEGAPKKRNRKGKLQLDLESLKLYFEMPLYLAAQQLGVSTTTLKKKCREHGLMRWPHVDYLRNQMNRRDNQQLKQRPSPPCAARSSASPGSSNEGSSEGQSEVSSNAASQSSSYVSGSGSVSKCSQSSAQSSGSSSKRAKRAGQQSAGSGSQNSARISPGSSSDGSTQDSSGSASGSRDGSTQGSSGSGSRGSGSRGSGGSTQKSQASTDSGGHGQKMVAQDGASAGGGLSASSMLLNSALAASFPLAPSVFQPLELPKDAHAPAQQSLQSWQAQHHHMQGQQFMEPAHASPMLNPAQGGMMAPVAGRRNHLAPLLEWQMLQTQTVQSENFQALSLQAAPQQHQAATSQPLHFFQGQPSSLAQQPHHYQSHPSHFPAHPAPLLPYAPQPSPSPRHSGASRQLPPDAFAQGQQGPGGIGHGMHLQPGGRGSQAPSPGGRGSPMPLFRSPAPSPSQFARSPSVGDMAPQRAGATHGTSPGVASSVGSVGGESRSMTEEERRQQLHLIRLRKAQIQLDILNMEEAILTDHQEPSQAAPQAAHDGQQREAAPHSNGQQRFS